MWLYNGNAFTEEDAAAAITDGYIGFVYIITDCSCGKKYIGKKLLTRRDVKPPLKGTRRKRIRIVQSDWQKYYGSNELIQEAVQNRKDDFTREILHLCKSKGELSYTEAKLQFEHEALLRADYYNSFIGCKIHAKHVKNLWKN